MNALVLPFLALALIVAAVLSARAAGKVPETSEPDRAAPKGPPVNRRSGRTRRGARRG